MSVQVHGLTDADIVHAVLNGERQQFRILFERYLPVTELTLYVKADHYNTASTASFQVTPSPSPDRLTFPISAEGQ